MFGKKALVVVLVAIVVTFQEESRDQCIAELYSYIFVGSAEPSNSHPSSSIYKKRKAILRILVAYSFFFLLTDSTSACFLKRRMRGLKFWANITPVGPVKMMVKL